MRAETLARPSMAARPRFTGQISIESSIDLKGGGTMPKALGSPNILSLPIHRITTVPSTDNPFTGKIREMTTIWQMPKPAEFSIKKALPNPTTVMRIKNPLGIFRRKTKPLTTPSVYSDKKTDFPKSSWKTMAIPNSFPETKPKNKVKKISVEMLKAFLAKQGQKPSIEAHSQSGQTKTAFEVQKAKKTELAKPLSATPALLRSIEPKARQAIRLMQVRQALAKEVAVTKPGEQTKASAEQAVKTQTLLQKKIEKAMDASKEEPGKTQKPERQEQEAGFEVDQSARAERKTIIQAAVCETEYEAKTQNPEQAKELSGASLAFKIMRRKTIKAMSEVAKINDGSFIKLAISAIGKKFHSAKEAKAEKIAVLEKTPPARIPKGRMCRPHLNREYVFRVILQGAKVNPFKTLAEKYN